MNCGPFYPYKLNAEQMAYYRKWCGRLALGMLAATAVITAIIVVL